MCLQLYICSFLIGCTYNLIKICAVLLECLPIHSMFMCPGLLQRAPPEALAGPGRAGHNCGTLLHLVGEPGITHSPAKTVPDSGVEGPSIQQANWRQMAPYMWPNFSLLDWCWWCCWCWYWWCLQLNSALPKTFPVQERRPGKPTPFEAPVPQPEILYS